PIISSPKYDCSDFTDVPYVDAAVVYSEEEETLTIFAVNKAEDQMETEISLRGFESYQIAEHIVLEHQDIKATNQYNRKNCLLY
ncbi:alpha-L-arabinofuranosidase C-terminal domain-containing protein, partial [Streptococcus pneumoniae]|uniref:alpha-L-arabinofuranosidase C-terminal domain-containing protein n=1 Tax=Streptococcus pneumoniae TaxID=1313 RepID=UPI0034D35182